MRVYGFNEDVACEIEIENKLESLQEFVRGLIEVVSITEEIDLVCNEEGKINGMSMTAAVLNKNGILVEIIAGPCFICRHDNEGNFTSIEDMDMDIIHSTVKRIKRLGTGIMLIEQ